MTPEERGEAMTRLARKLLGALEMVADEDVQRWGRCEPEGWAVIDEPEREFLLACATWQQSGHDGDLELVAEAFDRVVEAWRQAATAYHRREAHR